MEFPDFIIDWIYIYIYIYIFASHISEIVLSTHLIQPNEIIGVSWGQKGDKNNQLGDIMGLQL